MAAEKLGENSAVEAVLKHNNELKLITPDKNACQSANVLQFL
jgi:hypothetical protein